MDLQFFNSKTLGLSANGGQQLSRIETALLHSVIEGVLPVSYESVSGAEIEIQGFSSTRSKSSHGKGKIFLVVSVEYKTVFEISQKGFTWWFALVGLLPALPGVFIWRWRKSHDVSGRVFWLTYDLPGFALLWLCTCTIPLSMSFLRLQNSYRTGTYSIVEGEVGDFHPMPPQGHSAECFRVQNVSFCYGNDIITPGFNQDTAHGGPIRANLPIKVLYAGDTILRLDVGK